MFQVDRPNNRLRRLDRTTFSASGFTERGHLQEWLAAAPDALGSTLGDDLLIIQKEFDGFDGTRERLDLLALDRQGQLVVIENKLDDSGRDVVWQALKYAAYCSSLKKAEIVDIFQRYLDRTGGGAESGDATEAIREFLGEDAWEEVVLNAGNDQRIVFIAASFRREVTATVLWLREHGIDARCIRVVPYLFGEEVLVDLQQVIPTPEAADYMIRMAEKDTEEKSAKGAQRERHTLRQKFWTALLDAMREAGMERWANRSPSRDHWLDSSIGVSGCGLTLIFGRTEIRVELQMNRSDAGENKALFDRLAARREAFDEAFGGDLEWRRLGDKKVSMIVCRQAVQGYDEENWPGMIAWLQANYRRMDETFTDALREAAAEMKPGGA